MDDDNINTISICASSKRKVLEECRKPLRAEEVDSQRSSSLEQKSELSRLSELPKSNILPHSEDSDSVVIGSAASSVRVIKVREPPGERDADPFPDPNLNLNLNQNTTSGGTGGRSAFAEMIENSLSKYLGNQSLTGNFSKSNKAASLLPSESIKAYGQTAAAPDLADSQAAKTTVSCAGPNVANMKNEAKDDSVIHIDDSLESFHSVCHDHAEVRALLKCRPHLPTLV